VRDRVALAVPGLFPRERQLVEPEILIGNVEAQLDDLPGAIGDELGDPAIEPGKAGAPFQQEAVAVQRRQVRHQVRGRDQPQNEPAAFQCDRRVAVEIAGGMARSPGIP